MDTARAAVLKTLLEGVPLPAEKSELLAYATSQHAEPDLLATLRRLPDKEYESLTDVVEELVHAQPQRRDGEPTTPREQSGAPPGADDYTNANPDDTGEVAR
jgi:hypothetical protein